MIATDLSPYMPGSREHLTHNTIAVGWLGALTEFTVSEPDPEFLKHLLEFCGVKIYQTRGFHVCELCEEPTKGELTIVDGTGKVWIGSAQIRVIGKGRIYAAPDLIYHYVSEHHYSPPQEFIDAVLTGPQPDSREFRDLVYWYEQIHSA